VFDFGSYADHLNLGEVQLAGIDPDSGNRFGVSDPRGDWGALALPH
jgi:hypothetical protein